jgi:hypothetical protein
MGKTFSWFLGALVVLGAVGCGAGDSTGDVNKPVDPAVAATTPNASTQAPIPAK